MTVKQIYAMRRKSRLSFATLFVLLFSWITLSNLIQPPAQVGAVGACPGQERQGTGTAPLTDQNKCYLDGKPTSNTPANTADPGQAGGSDPSGANSTEEGSPCAVEKIGWILCPIIEGAAKMGDWAFNFLADNFLQIEPELLTSEPQGGNGKGTITAWQYARDLANIMFVIAFVIIIFSQVTGQGLNNYGIKRMLPRLIIAAIAVNLSYYICQAMVDISNLLGYNIKQALTDIANGPNGIGPQVLGQDNQGTNTQTSSGGGTLALISVGILAIAGLVWVLLPIMGSIIMFILVTCVVVVIILLLRKAFIVLLVVVSPIAFVMYLLPNTEKYFNKWLSMFWKLLMVFPIIALLMGGGQLASTIILVAGTGSPQAVPCGEDQSAAQPAPGGGSQETVSSTSFSTSGECSVTIGDRQANATLGLVAAGVAVAPLLAVWSVLQGALSAAGAIGGKITGAIQKGTNRVGNKVGGGIDAAGKGLRGYAGASAGAAWQRTQARGLNGDVRDGRFGGRIDRAAGAFARRKAARSAMLNTSKDELAREMTREASQAAPHPGLTAAGTRRVESRAIAAERKEQADEIQAAHLVVDHLDPRDVSTGTIGGQVGDRARELITSGQFDSPHLAALLEQLAKSNRQAFMNLTTQLNNSVAASAGGARSTVASRAASGAMSSMSFYSGGDAARVARGEAFNLQQQAVDNITNGGLSPSDIADAPHNEIVTIDAITSGNAAARGALNGTFGRMSNEQKNKLSSEDHTTASGW